MEQLKLYRIEDKYINYLKSRDDKVQHNKNKHRPYVGVVLFVSDCKYFVPLESPKPNHKNMKSGKHLLKIDSGELGIMGFNNMIPVNDKALISFNINDEKDIQYANLLKNQVLWINKNKASVLARASKTYYSVSNKKNKFLCKISCDFKKLEKASKKYNPNYPAKQKK